VKIGVFLDKFLNDQFPSFYVKGNDSFYLKNDKLMENSFKVKGAWFSWTDWCQGVFINLSEFNSVPKFDLDIIFVCLEWHIDKIDEIRKAYPNALICAIIKELYFISSIEDRIKFFNKCDRILSMYKNINMSMNYSYKFNKNVDWLPCPIDVHTYEKLFSKQKKEDKIVIYLPKCKWRRGNTEKFGEFLSKKYNIDYIKLETSSMYDFLNLVSKYKYILNMDPEPQLGQQTIYNAIFKNMNIGGLNDANKILYPETSTNDDNILETIFCKSLNDKNYFDILVNKSYKSVIETYSYESVTNRFNSILTTSNEKPKIKTKIRPLILNTHINIKTI
jgi:hypothetical protein